MASPPAPDQPRVAIIGTGFGGIAMAVRLLEDGLQDVVLLERADDTGGTWRDNTYPGAACDIPSHLYSLSFEPKGDWTRRYSPQPEIRAYLDDVVERHGLRGRTRFGFDVRALAWDEATSTWTLTSQDGDRVVADVVVNAVGALKDPRWPAIEGLDDFEGPLFHSARWDHGADLAGRRVGVVGTGASAIQFVPELAEVAGHLTVLQRTPPWIVPRGDRAYRWWERALYDTVAPARLAHRFATWASHELTHLVFASDGPVRDLGERYARWHLQRQVPDSELRATLTPDYELGCKRILRSDDYYPALARPDVTVETRSIARVTPTGVELADGDRVELDALVLGTGFTVDDPLHGTVVTGRDGRDLDGFWDGRPSAHLGITVPGFPNHFLLLGPNTGLGHNSVVVMIEAQVEYVRRAVALLRRDDVASIEVTEQAHDEFVAWVDEQNADATWSSGCSSWYLNDRGENFSVWPGTTASYKLATRRLDRTKHVVRAPARTPATAPGVTPAAAPGHEPQEVPA